MSFCKDNKNFPIGVVDKKHFDPPNKYLHSWGPAVSLNSCNQETKDAKYIAFKPNSDNTDNTGTCYFFNKKIKGDDTQDGTQDGIEFNYIAQRDPVDDNSFEKTDPNTFKVYPAGNEGCDHYTDGYAKELKDDIDEKDNIRAMLKGGETYLTQIIKLKENSTYNTLNYLLSLVNISYKNKDKETKINKYENDILNTKNTQKIEYDSNLNKIERNLEESREKEKLQHKITTILGIIIVLFSILTLGLLLYYMLGGSEGIKNIKEKTNTNIFNNLFGLNKKITSANKKAINKLF